MQKLNLILDILRTRSKNGMKITRIYRYLYNKEFYLEAYEQLSKNNVHVNDDLDETIDGMSLARIDDIIEEMRYEQYKWHKLAQFCIPKSNNKFRILLVPEWRDKLVQKVLQIILSAIYEPKFSDASHGYRPNRGCHTALARIYKTGQACDFFIEGDISDCFDSIDHTVLLNIFKRDIDDGRFIELIRKMLKAGKCCNDFVYGKTYSGIPQGGVLSPLLANIYLNEFDKWVETELVPKWNIGKSKPPRKEYNRLNDRVCANEKRLETIKDPEKRTIIKKTLKDLRFARSKVKSRIKTGDGSYRRLTYTRYADDWIMTVTGTYKECLEIKDKIKQYLSSALKLTLNDEKTRIVQSNDSKNPVRFLGYNIITQYGDTHMLHGKRTLNGIIGFMIPRDVINQKIRQYCVNGIPKHRPELINDTVFDIIKMYQAEFRGIVQYYKFARNQRALSKIKYVMEVSLVKTLANKLKKSMHKIYDLYKGTHITNGKSYKVLKCTISSSVGKIYEAYFGAIPLIRKKAMDATVVDDNIIKIKSYNYRSSLSQRLVHDVCEICGSNDKIEMHHINKMKDIKNNKAPWAKKMIASNRKTIALCHKHHMQIHAGRYNDRAIR